MNHKIILGVKWITVLCDALGLEANTIRRIIIDAAADSLVILYVEKYGDERMLDIEPISAEFAKVVVLGGEEAESNDS
ncbi:MAG: hypothetical protein KKD44_27785 [Proteobacteria bacterium]|nr:hypothetical protein [Pseudomonadota bacterium]